MDKETLEKGLGLAREIEVLEQIIPITLERLNHEVFERVYSVSNREPSLPLFSEKVAKELSETASKYLHGKLNKLKREFAKL